MRTCSAVVATCLALCLAACGGQTQKQVLQKHAAAIDKTRAALKAIQGDLPPAGSLKENVKADPPLNPPLKSVTESLGSTPDGNTEWLHAEQLANPDDRGPLDCVPASNLGYALVWTDPKSKYFRSEDAEAGESFDATIAAATSSPYLIVVRMTDVILPKVNITTKQFTPGSARMEGFLYSMPGAKRLASFVTTAHTPDTVNYQFKPGEEQARADAFARSALWEACRAAMTKAASEVTGGAIAFR